MDDVHTALEESVSYAFAAVFEQVFESLLDYSMLSTPSVPSRPSQRRGTISLPGLVASSSTTDDVYEVPVTENPMYVDRKTGEDSDDDYEYEDMANDDDYLMLGGDGGQPQYDEPNAVRLTKSPSSQALAASRLGTLRVERKEKWIPEDEAHNYEWYRPHMTRHQVNDALKPQPLHAFLVYCHLDSREPLSKVPVADIVSPSFVLPEPTERYSIEHMIETFQVVEEIPVEEPPPPRPPKAIDFAVPEVSTIDSIEQPENTVEPVLVPEPTQSVSVDPVLFKVEAMTPQAVVATVPTVQPVEMPEPSTVEEVKPKRLLPIAKRVQKMATVVRRGQKLGTFIDDSHLDVVVDKDTRIVLAEKALPDPVRRKSYGKRMFPNLPAADEEAEKQRKQASLKKEVLTCVHTSLIHAHRRLPLWLLSSLWSFLQT